MTQLNPKQVKHTLRRVAKESSSGLLVFKPQLLDQIDGKLGEYHSGHLHRETALAKAEQIKWGSEQLILTRLQEEPVLRTLIEIIISSPRLQLVVPFAAELSGTQLQFMHLRLGDFAASLVRPRIEFGLHAKASRRTCVADQVHDGFEGS
jgi:hypothetical protein